MYFAVAIRYSLIFRRRNYCVIFPLSIDFAAFGGARRRILMTRARPQSTA
jgi:hypothetical protein